MTIHCVLLIPEESDPLNLLAEGPCGARPPVAVTSQFDRRVDAAPDGRWYPCVKDGTRIPGRCALVLAWDGEPVQVGLWAAVATLSLRWVGWMLPFYSMGQAEAIGRLCESEGMGALVLLDSEGREVPND